MNDITPSRTPRPSKSSISGAQGSFSGQPNAVVSSTAARQNPAKPTSLSKDSAHKVSQAKPPLTTQTTTSQALNSSSPLASKSQLLLEKKQPSRLKKVLLWLAGIILFLALCIGAALWWYVFSLTPYSGGDATRVRIEIASGMTPSAIGQLLEEKKLIRSQHAFEIYTRFSGVRDKLQAGTYTVSPSESTEQIVAHLVAGKVDTFSITFLPGATLADHRKQLLDAGYSGDEVDTALQKTYESPLFADKPASADLEGYIYGETYEFPSGASVQEILTKIFAHYYEVIKENDIVDGLKARRLTLYQGITLASIIQKEVSGAADQKQVAQVFYSRLAIGMPLGADATFRYAAKKMGVPPSVNLESPYNTRKYTGLPPGPIASPGLGALQAATAPASGDYLYFVSGDDGKNYFSRTLEEHEAATQAHCHQNCQL